MLKIVGMEHGEVADEKIILTEEGKLTVFGALIVSCVVFTNVVLCILIGKIVKRCCRCKCKKL